MKNEAETSVSVAIGRTATTEGTIPYPRYAIDDRILRRLTRPLPAHGYPASALAEDLALHVDVVETRLRNLEYEGAVRRCSVDLLTREQLWCPLISIPGIPEQGIGNSLTGEFDMYTNGTP